MSGCYEKARVQIFLADFANVDAAQKINAIGVGFQLAGFNTQTGAVVGQAIIAMIEVPADLEGERYSLEVTLLNRSGEHVTVPGPAGEPTALRIGSVVTAERPPVPVGQVPPGWLFCRHQFIANFGGGLPIPAGEGYEWRVSIDGETKPGWAAGFAVPGAPSAPVIG